MTQPARSPDRSFVMVKKIAVLCCCVVVAGTVVAILTDETSTLREAASRANAEEAERFPSGGDDHVQLKVVLNSAGIDEPEFEMLSEAVVDEATRVIGIVVGEEQFAFVIDAMEDELDHIVNCVVGTQPVSVTYCSLQDCARVLTSSEESDQPLEVRLGGLDDNMHMVLMYQGLRYGQTSDKLPLKDYPHKVTTLSDWKRQHPTSKLYRQSSRKSKPAASAG